MDLDPSPTNTKTYLTSSQKKPLDTSMAYSHQSGYPSNAACSSSNRGTDSRPEATSVDPNAMTATQEKREEGDELAKLSEGMRRVGVTNRGDLSFILN